MAHGPTDGLSLGLIPSSVARTSAAWVRSGRRRVGAPDGQCRTKAYATPHPRQSVGQPVLAIRLLRTGPLVHGLLPQPSGVLRHDSHIRCSEGSVGRKERTPLVRLSTRVQLTLPAERKGQAAGMGGALY